MRDPERIPRILAKIQEIWQKYPDLRLGQLIVNVSPKHERNLFYAEDDELEHQLELFKAMSNGLDRR
ncbi:MAG: hypothetical protein KAV87_30300 [Desulfobacteraceae bacterium]|nr:hypothetical protein [Desulfobacteraceae bacterium]